MNPPLLKLVVLRERLAVCRLDAKAPIPEWATGEAFLSISRTPDELSVICEDRFVPDGTRASRGWQGFKISWEFWFRLPCRWLNQILGFSPSRPMKPIMFLFEINN